MRYLVFLFFLPTYSLTARIPQNDKALLKAAKRNDRAEVQKQIARKAQVNTQDKKGRTPLHRASSPEVVEELILAGADPDYTTKGNDKRTPLYDALVAGNRDKAMTLILLGAEVNTHHKDGYTPLKWAIEHNDYELTFHLIQAGAKVHPKMVEFAQKHGYQSIATLLSQYRKAKDKSYALNKFDKHDFSPMHYAVLKNDPIKLDALVLARGKINLKNSLGQTPLHIAVENNLPSMVQKLLELFAKTNIEDNKGRIPLQIARQLNLPKIIRMLRAHGAHAIL